MNTMFLLQLIGLSILTHHVNSARILAIVPTAAYSHQMFYQQLWRELAIRGHDMVVITTDPTGEILPNFKEVSIKECYGPTKKVVDVFIKEGAFKMLLSNKMYKLLLELGDFRFSLPQIQEILKNKTEHFDLVMAEQFSPLVCGLKHRFKCPMIGLTSLDAYPGSHASVGNPVHSVLYPIHVLPFQDNLTFLQRLIVFMFTIIFETKQFLNSDMINDISRKHFGADAPDIHDLQDETDMLFVNANPLFTAIRPFAPAAISLAGGMHMKPQQPLPHDLKAFLDNAPEGVVYFSLGSNVRSNELSLEFRQTIMETLSQVPYKVLWKFEDDTLPGKPENVKITKWAPQQDVLRHTNVKVFITQAGLQSLEEALYSHVPLVAMPFFSDQTHNAEKIAANGLGLVQDRHNLKVEDFKSAIIEVIENPKYKDSVVHLANRIQDEPMKPLDKAIWWTEYVLRYKGAKHLKGAKIPFYQYYYFDIFAFLGLVVVILSGLGFGIVKLIIMSMKRMFKCQTKMNKAKKS